MQPSPRSTFNVNATAWSRGLEVTGGTDIVSHSGLVLLRQLSDRTGLTSGLSKALPPAHRRRLMVTRDGAGALT
jgi:hypothetical protein